MRPIQRRPGRIVEDLDRVTDRRGSEFVACCTDLPTEAVTSGRLEPIGDDGQTACPRQPSLEHPGDAPVGRYTLAREAAIAMYLLSAPEDDPRKEADEQTNYDGFHGLTMNG